MPTSQPPLVNGVHRRVVLIDFDWQDADLLPELLRQPAVSVRLVAGRDHQDAGLRVAELCGVPCTIELADLTREIFDLALIGEGSPRRAQIEHLFHALGTPVASPRSFLDRARVLSPRSRAAGHGHPPENGNASPDPLELAELVDDTLPDLETGAEASSPSSEGGSMDLDARDLPDLHDRRELETYLSHVAESTGAFAVELHRGDGELRVIRSGPQDPLLAALVDVAVRLDSQQVVSLAHGPQTGRIWGAWPFRAAGERAVLAAAAADPEAGTAIWEHVVLRLTHAWNTRQRHGSRP